MDAAAELRDLVCDGVARRKNASIREAAAKLQISGQEVFEKKLQPETQAALAAKSYTKTELPLIARAMTRDVSRSSITINGQAFAKGAETDFPAVYSAFKKALPGEKAQKAISSIMHQGGLGDLTATMLKAPHGARRRRRPRRAVQAARCPNALPARHERE